MFIKTLKGQSINLNMVSSIQTLVEGNWGDRVVTAKIGNIQYALHSTRNIRHAEMYIDAVTKYANGDSDALDNFVVLLENEQKSVEEKFVEESIKEDEE